MDYVAKERIFLFRNIDAYVALSRENTKITDAEVVLFDDVGDDEFWDKVGQVAGNLERLMTLRIHFLRNDDDYDGEEARMTDWE